MRTSIDLFWLPLGAGGNSVRWNGRIFEWVVARIERPYGCELYHSALEVRVPRSAFRDRTGAPRFHEVMTDTVVAETWQTEGDAS